MVKVGENIGVLRMRICVVMLEFNTVTENGMFSVF